MLQPSSTNKTFHARTRAKAKMYEYAVPLDQHINTGTVALSDMLDLTIGMLGDLTAGTFNNLEEEKYRLLFSAQYFNSILEAEVISHSQRLLQMLSSSAYYLAGYPGSSQVLLKGITDDEIERLNMMERFLFAVLKRRPFLDISQVDLYYESAISLADAWNSFLERGSSYEELDELSSILRSNIYLNGTDKDLLLVDVVRTLILKRFNVSVRSVLSENSDVRMELWEPYFSRPHHIDEFWPSQVKLAEYNVFKGASAVIQMPTSAGKTKATEFIVRSSFLSGRATRAVIVAPFRALCQEIYNDFTRNFSEDTDVDINLVSDVLQDDFVSNEGQQKSLLILTPEKLDFMLRHDPQLAETIGLIIYDEGHLFDDDKRGSKYELLLSSLKQRLLVNTQVVLISAVIANAQQVKEWLIDQDGVLVDGKDLSPTNRSVAFVEWTSQNRFIQFVDETNVNRSLFFVPSILKSYEIERRRRERRKFFPKPKPRGGYEPSQIAGFLGARLAAAGLSAIFVGQKKSAQKIAKDLIDAFDRNLPINKPLDFSENAEQSLKVIAYVEKVLGTNSINTKSAQLGILMHHAGIPHGLKLVTEHALQHSYFKTVICTSTLAQGVNLPIRYLIISTSYQAGEKIKTRDFHNLMGRAGRSGKYTEGTIIFANPDIYASRTFQGRKWAEARDLLNSNNSEPSRSQMLMLLSPRPEDDEELQVWERRIRSIRKEITSYLLNALSDVDEIREMEQIVTTLTQNTLGYSQLENEEQKTILMGIFLEIGLDIINEVPDKSERLVYGRSILSIEQSKSIVASMQANIDQIIATLESGFTDSISMFWDYLYQYTNNRIIKSFTQEDALVLCRTWIEGASFLEILELAESLPRTGLPRLEMLHIIDLCESGFSYDISTLLGSVYELTTIVIPDEYLFQMKPECYLIQKRLKYGTSSEIDSTIYELGFSDRQLSSEIATLLEGSPIDSRGQIIRSIKETVAIREKIEAEYPHYFLERLNGL